MAKNLKMKAARAAMDMSQQELADRIEVSRQTINAIEKDIKDIKRADFQPFLIDNSVLQM